MGPIGVFLRCTGRDDPSEALAAVRSIGLRTIQISKLDDRFYSPSGAGEFKFLMESCGVQATSVVIVFDGESYKDVPSVMSTVGFRPAELVEERLEYSRNAWTSRQPWVWVLSRSIWDSYPPTKPTRPTRGS